MRATLPVLALLAALTSAVPSKLAAGPLITKVEQSGAITGELLKPTKIDQSPAGAASLNSVEAVLAGCIIRGYSGNTCDGSNLYAYEFAPEPNCRSCVFWGGSHSFSLEGNCRRYFEMWTSDRDRCSGNNRLAGGGPPIGCWNVNTGFAWDWGDRKSVV